MRKNIKGSLGRKALNMKGKDQRVFDNYLGLTFERCAFFISDIEIFTSYNLRELFFIEKSINAAKFSDLIKVDNYEVSDKGGDLCPGLLC